MPITDRRLIVAKRCRVSNTIQFLKVKANFCEATQPAFLCLVSPRNWNIGLMKEPIVNVVTDEGSFEFLGFIFNWNRLDDDEATAGPNDPSEFTQDLGVVRLVVCDVRHETCIKEADAHRDELPIELLDRHSDPRSRIIAHVVAFDVVSDVVIDVVCNLSVATAPIDDRLVWTKEFRDLPINYMSTLFHFLVEDVGDTYAADFETLEFGIDLPFRRFEVGGFGDVSDDSADRSVMIMLSVEAEIVERVDEVSMNEREHVHVVQSRPKAILHFGDVWSLHDFSFWIVVKRAFIKTTKYIILYSMYFVYSDGSCGP